MENFPATARRTFPASAASDLAAAYPCYMQTLSKTFSAWSTVQAVQKQCNKAPVEENSEQHKQLYDAEVFFGICFH